MIAQLQVRRGTNAQWTAANPILASGEIGETTDAPFLIKIGDGTSTWSALRTFAIPDGGATSEVLVKASATSRDLTWAARARPAEQTVFASAANAQAWTKPTDCKTVLIQCMGSGGGGGSGARGLTTALRHGGGGGQAGSYTELELEAADLPATIYATIGTAGLGGGQQTLDSNSGLTGNDGSPAFASTSNSAVLATAAESAIVLGSGGLGGVAGLITTPPTAQTRVEGGFILGGLGALPSGTTTQQPYQGGGGAGGSLTAANALVANGSFGSAFGKGIYGRVGAASPAAGANGIAGSTSTARIAGVVAPGVGGSGGASHTGGTAGTGGAGDRGGGGGGGGASANTFNSGAGGAGGVGFVIITAYF